MTARGLSPRKARSAGRETARHMFAIGQFVRLKRRELARFSGPSDVYHVTGTLPPRAGSPQYRIRNDNELHERVTTEDQLEPLGMSQSRGAARLIERTFGAGQGTKT